jgi:hypothetical protein
MKLNETDVMNGFITLLLSWDERRNPEGAPPRRIATLHLFHRDSVSNDSDLERDLPAPPCPARAPEAGSHHNSGFLFHHLNSGIPDPENHRKFPDPAVPKRGP